MSIKLSKTSFKVEYDELKREADFLGDLEKCSGRKELESFLYELGQYESVEMYSDIHHDNSEWKTSKLITSSGIRVLSQIRRKVATISHATALSNTYVSYSKITQLYDTIVDLIGYMYCMDEEVFQNLYPVLLHLQKAFEIKALALPAYEKFRYNLSRSPKVFSENAISKWHKRHGKDYAEMTAGISKFDASFIKKLAKQTARAMALSKKHYSDYFRQAYIRQDDIAAQVIENYSHVPFDDDAYNALKMTINKMYSSSTEESNLEEQLVEAAKPCYEIVLKDRIAYYKRGRLAILNEAIRLGFCPTDYVITHGVVCSENENISLKDRNQAIHKVFEYLLNSSGCNMEILETFVTIWKNAISVLYSCVMAAKYEEVKSIGNRRLVLSYITPDSSVTTSVAHVQAPWNQTRLSEQEASDLISVLKFN